MIVSINKLHRAWKARPLGFNRQRLIHLLYSSEPIWKNEPAEGTETGVKKMRDQGLVRARGKRNLTLSAEYLYAWEMEVRLTPEQEAQLSRIASHDGVDTDCLVQEAVIQLMEEKERFSAAIREGVAQADRGELIDDDEVRFWLEQRERL